MSTESKHSRAAMEERSRLIGDVWLGVRSRISTVRYEAGFMIIILVVFAYVSSKIAAVLLAIEIADLIYISITDKLKSKLVPAAYVATYAVPLSAILRMAVSFTRPLELIYLDVVDKCPPDVSDYAAVRIIVDAFING